MQQDSELLPWQEEPFRHLLAEYDKNRLAHAYLLQGPAGVGKFTFGRHLAHRLLCISPHGYEPCRQCKACQLFMAGTHPDLKLVEPEDNSRVIKIEQVRASVDFMAKTANQGGYKIVIFRPVESMNVNAANALLKTLEEPPPGTLLLLISHQPGLVMATLKSRSQPLNFAIPPAVQARSWLDSKHVSGSSEVLLALADGAPLKALSLGDEETQQRRSTLHECLLGIMDGNLSVVDAAQQMQNGSLDDTLETLMFCVHDLLRTQQSGGQLALKDPDLKPLLGHLDKTAASARLHAFYRELLGLKRALVRNSNPNPRLALESLLYTWSSL